MGGSLWFIVNWVRLLVDRHTVHSSEGFVTLCTVFIVEWSIPSPTMVCHYLGQTKKHTSTHYTNTGENCSSDNVV